MDRSIVGRPGRQRMHADLGIDQHVEFGIGDGLGPVGESDEAVDEVGRVAARAPGLVVARAIELEQRQLDALAGEVAHPALRDRVPYRMLADLRGRDAHAQAALRQRHGRMRAARPRRPEPGGQQARDRLAVGQQQRSCVDRMVGEVERLCAAHRQRARAGARRREPGVEFGQCAREVAPRAVHLARAFVDRAQVRHREREARPRILRIDFERARKLLGGGIARGEQRIAVPEEGRRVGARGCGGAPVQLDGLLDAILREMRRGLHRERGAGLGMRLGVDAAMLHRLLRAASVDEGRDERLVRGRQRGIELQRLAKPGDGGVEVALLAQEDAEVVVGRGIAGRAADARVERRARRVDLAERRERLAALAERLGCVRRQRQRLVGRGQRPLGVAGGLARDGQVQPGLRVARPGLHAALEHGGRAAVVAGVQQRGAEQVGDLCGFRVARVGPLQRRHRFGDPPELAQDVAEVGLRVDVLRLRLGRTLELFARLLQATAAQQRGAEVVQRAGILGLGREGLRDQRLGPRRSPRCSATTPERCVASNCPGACWSTRS